jgi:hypothetical protein
MCCHPTYHAPAALSPPISHSTADLHRSHASASGLAPPVAADSVQIAVSETGTASGAGKRGPAAGSMRGPIVPIVRPDTRPISRRRTRFSSSDTPRNSEGRLRCAHANAIRLHCAIRLRATDDDRRSDHRRCALCSRRMTFTRRALPRVGSRGVGTVAHYRQHPSAAAHCSPKKHSRWCRPHRGRRRAASHARGAVRANRRTLYFVFRRRCTPARSARPVPVHALLRWHHAAGG